MTTARPYNGYKKEELEAILLQMEMLAQQPNSIVKRLSLEFSPYNKGAITTTDGDTYYVPDFVQPSQHSYYGR